MAPQKYSTPERRERILASKRAWAQRNADYRRQKNKEYSQRPEYAEQRKRWYQNWKQKQLDNRGPQSADGLHLCTRARQTERTPTALPVPMQCGDTARGSRKTDA